MEREALIKKLTEYFEERGDVVMAFLFGSHANERAHAGSDWDIAVYFKPETKRIEYEELDCDYPQEARIWADCINILKTDNVDLLVLNRAHASIADAAIRGTPLVIKDRGLWLEFMLIITGVAADFREFASDYYEIYTRSKSLNDQDADRLRRIIEFLENQTTLYSAFSSLSMIEYEKDLIKRGAVERWIENMVSAIADISKIVLSTSKKPSPYGYADTVRTAAMYLNLEEDFWNKFLNWIKLRNILAHEYLDVKWKRINGFIRESEPYVQSFVEAAKKFLEKNRPE